MSPLPPNPLGVEVVSISFVGVFVDACIILLRLWARRLKGHRKLDMCDYLIIAAWVIALADAIRKIFAWRWGAGLHMEQILSTDPSHLTSLAQITFVDYFLWCSCVTCIKLSILLVYKQIFYCVRWFLWAVHTIMALCVLFFIGFFIGLCLRCTPFAANYNAFLPGAKCGLTQSNAFILSGSLNMAVDGILVLLPLPVVWNLKISRIKKLGVTAMFGLGTLILVLVGIRFKLVLDTNPDDFTHDGEPPGIFSSLELYLGIISACLPFISPALLKMKESTQQSYIYALVASFSRRGDSSRASSHGYSSHGYTDKFGQPQGADKNSQRSGESLSAAYKSNDESALMAEGSRAENETQDISLKAWPTNSGYTRDYKVESVAEERNANWGGWEPGKEKKGITMTSGWEVEQSAKDERR